MSRFNYELYQNYPNPFNPATTIDFEIASPVNVNLIIYNMLGEQVEVLISNQLTEAGVHSVRFDASTLASGTYIYRLQAGSFVETKKMMLTK
ncbi:MAG: T9SS C-terminal target domain-containing protein [Ignavibacteriales bacterium]|nr:MAG: T9SS C-terminal target domain-containing protein [Ignavibacteriales bacterium]